MRNKNSVFLVTTRGPIELKGRNQKEADIASVSGRRHKRHKRYQRDRVRPILNQLFPNGVPPESELPNDDLVQRVQKAVPKKGSYGLPSSKSILREAGRITD